MTTTKEPTNELPPLVISPLYSDCKIRVPLDDRSGFHTYNLHLCMLYESYYFEQMVPNPKKVHAIPTLKSHFEIILRYIYNKQQIIYNNDNLLDLITEGYRFYLNDFVSHLWSVFATSATAKMVIDALKNIESQREFYKRWDEYSLRTAIKRNILTVLDMSRELKSSKSIQLLIQSADDQNPDVILKKLQQWDAPHQGLNKNSLTQSVQNFFDASVKRYHEKNNRALKSNDGHFTRAFLPSMFSKDVIRNSVVTSKKISLPCVIGATAELNFSFGSNKISISIQSISPLKITLVPTYSIDRNLVVRLWDKEETFYVAKWGKTETNDYEYDIMNAAEWTKDKKLQFEVMKMDDKEIDDKCAPQKPVEQPPAFRYPANREKLSADFIVECQDDEDGPVIYKLHKFILLQSPHFQRMFSMSSFIEAKTNKATIETSKILFEIILRYLYNQQPLKGISSIITDAILEASYFDLSDFENELWSLFEQEADVTNCIKAINLIESNMHFKVNESKVMKVVAKNIKEVMKYIDSVPNWSMVRTILTMPCTKKQNPLRIFKSVKQWCMVHEPKICQYKVREICSEVLEFREVPPIIAKEIQAKFPYLTGIKIEKADFSNTETFLLSEGSKAELQILGKEYGDNVRILKSSELYVDRAKGTEVRLHDKLSSHYSVVKSGTILNRVVENIEEWKYGGFYRISVIGYK